ncbi:hypothetical protein [Rathayibacter tanaceti]|uniref:Uncharacterized protein n=2 Tax=Rathayibacter tanaceti TaxID=1671680 RepID=A0A166HZ87_9MICO|nr:hypothetical protein [Rathayibacter tanaceti]KZX21383.1 hypothetical protein ACH61_01479 [Rathayibacter tanaceti]QHC54950.1 hypothetical protein GSU10_04350 [Rathayibacter tanaceti]TCO38492.1 hypothetical protein EV639_102135 [Rathayibacter tanaceti]
MHWWSGEHWDYQLRCGQPDDASGKGGWGYKHIREDHEQNWQDKFNEGLALGWVPESQGFESWDDLMATSGGNAGLWPDHMRAVDPKGGTTCLIAIGVFYDAFSGAELGTFNYRTIFSNTTERLITSFPQSGTTCPSNYTQLW